MLFESKAKRIINKETAKEHFGMVFNFKYCNASPVKAPRRVLDSKSTLAATFVLICCLRELPLFAMANRFQLQNSSNDVHIHFR